MPIDLDLLLAGRDLTEPTPSPDGRSVAFVQRWAGTSAVMVVPIGGGPERVASTGPEPAAGRGLGGGCLAWSPSGHGFVYAAVDGELWLQAGPTVRRLTSLERNCRAPVVSPDGSVVVLIVDEAEVWRVDVATGEAGRLDDGADAFCFDPAISPDGTTVAWQAWSPPDMPWDGSHRCATSLRVDGPMARWRPVGGAVQQPRFGPAGESVCVHDGSGWLNVYVDDVPVLAEAAEHAGPSWGMGQRSFAVSPDGSKVALCRNESGFGRLVVVDRTTSSVTNVGRGDHGGLHWVGDTIVALRTGAVTPTQIVTYDVGEVDPVAPAEQPARPRRTVLAVGPPAGWSDIALPEPRLVAVEHDGATLHARHYVAGGDRMLVWVHGGPTDQWRADWRPRISYWWSRGWDVLVVDPRGTTGHGRSYQRALNGAWGRLDVDDTAALTEHVQRAAGITPGRTVAIGGSSGGLTVLGLLADHASLVAGGVTSYPVSDLDGLAAATHRFEAHYNDTLVGDTPTSELSPSERAGDIRGPLLVFHGTDDPVVPIDQSRRLVASIAANDGTADLVEYDGEGHGFRNPDNVRDEYGRTERFLAALVAM